MGNVFKYKLDFYYQQALSYLLVFLVYAGVKGSFFENEFVFVFRDPIVYIMMFFVAIALVTLILNLIRNRKLVIADDKIIFHSRYRELEIKFSEIEWMHIGREMLVQTAGRFQLIIIKMKGRRRLFRIRVGRYERDRELVAEMERIAERVPKGRRGRFGMRRRKAF
ncbi:MAG: hypothetical protein HY088_09170 [Ignavibacteriales bacterium]|nr:hypothetical protein [Ignavibacteriales bacterium]